jgi:hypothetical protein
VLDGTQHTGGQSIRDDVGEKCGQHWSPAAFKGTGRSGRVRLDDGSMPVYIGKGNISARIKAARRSRRRGQFWDRFSWFGLANAKTMHDIEVLLLKMFPKYLRSLTNQDGHFDNAGKEREHKKHRTADVITRKIRRKKQ